MLKKIFAAIILVVTVNCLSAQILHPVKWSYAAKRIGKNEAVLFLKATIEDGWHIYSAYQEASGPVKTAFVFTPAKDYILMGNVTEPAPVNKFEEAFNMQVKYFEHSAIFQQKISLKSAHPVVSGKLTYMVCNNQKCLSPEDLEFSIPVK